MEHPFLMFLDHTQRRSTVGRTPLDEWSARRRDLYLTIHDSHNRQITMPPVGFKPTISAGEQPQAARLLRFRASIWFHCKNFIMMHGHMNVKKIYQNFQLTLSCYRYLKLISSFKFEIVSITNSSLFLSFGATALSGPGPPHLQGF